MGQGPGDYLCVTCLSVTVRDPDWNNDFYIHRLRRCTIYTGFCRHCGNKIKYGEWTQKIVLEVASLGLGDFD